MRLAFLSKTIQESSTYMVVEQSVRAHPASQRIRNAREALLDPSANSVLQCVREIMCEPTRTQIVRALSKGPLAVSELASILGRSKSATSQHLRALREAGVVSARRRGRVVTYRLATMPMVVATVEMLDQAAALAVD
jgi:DNA-binding transcriptional ArsR family regulator